MNIKQIKLENLSSSNYQTRLSKIEEERETIDLSRSIIEIGLLNPITVVHNQDDKYTIIAGHRRYAAAKIAKLDEISCNLLELKDNNQKLLLNIIENIQRKDLSEIETAFALDKLKRKLKLTNQELSTIIRKSERYIKQHLALLNLHEDIQSDIIDNQTKTNKKILESMARMDRKLEETQKSIFFDLKNEVINEHEAMYLIQEARELNTEENSFNQYYNTSWKNNSFIIDNIPIENREIIEKKIKIILDEYSIK